MKETKLLGSLLPSHPDAKPIIEKIREKHKLPEISPDDDPITEIYLDDKIIPLEDFRQEIEIMVQESDIFITPESNLYNFYRQYKRLNGKRPKRSRSELRWAKEARNKLLELYKIFENMGNSFVKLIDGQHSKIADTIYIYLLTGESEEAPHDWFSKVETVNVDGKTARWEIEPRETEIVHLVFDLYVNKRMKGTQIANYLESEGVQTRKGTTKWWSAVVYRILKSEAYIGNAYMFKNSYVEPLKTPKSKKYRKVKNSAQKSRPREEWIGIPVTPIIDQKLWDAAQVLLKKNAHSARRNNNKNEYLVRGLVVCGLCGCMASGYVSNKSTFYSCGAKRNKNIHSKPHDELIQVHHKPFDAKIWQGLTELLHDPENLKAQLEKKLDRKNVAHLPATTADTKTDKDLEKLDVQEKRILDAYRAGIIDLDELKSQKGKIASNRKTLNARKKAVASHVESAGQTEITF